MRSAKRKAEVLANQPEAPPAAQSRRSFFPKLGLGALIAAVLGQGYAFLRALVPNVLYEEPRRFKVGTPDQFPEGATFVEDHRLFVVRERNTLHAISAVCSHLGCTVKMMNLLQPKKVKFRGSWVEETREFHCPCHGSKYYGDGSNYAGPAPKPLAWYKLEISLEDGQLVVDLAQPVEQGFRITVSA